MFRQPQATVCCMCVCLAFCTLSLGMRLNVVSNVDTSAKHDQSLQQERSKTSDQLAAQSRQQIVQVMQEDIAASIAYENAQALKEAAAVNLTEDFSMYKGISTGKAAESCQYAAFPKKRPTNDKMVAVCLKGPNVDPKITKACKDSYSSKSRIMYVEKDELSIGDCEQLCTENWNCLTDSKGVEKCDSIPELQGGCRGYVTRTPFKAEPDREPMCWLMAMDIPMSTAMANFPEVKFDDHVLHGWGRTTTKQSFLKHHCDCGTRLVHVERHDQKTKLHLMKAEVANFLLIADENVTAEGRRARDARVTDLRVKIRALEGEMKENNKLSALSGVYDWLPMLIPHRIRKGKLNWIPTALLNQIANVTKHITNQDSSWSTFWDGPVRISNVYKSLDLSSVLYKCLDKMAEPQVEKWYIASKDLLMSEVKGILDAEGIQDADEELAAPDVTSQKGVAMALALFFQMRCMGYQIEDDGTLKSAVKGAGGEVTWTPISTKINPDFLDNLPGEKITWTRAGSMFGTSNTEYPGWSGASSKGCFKNSFKATQAEEKLVIAEILNSKDGSGFVIPEEENRVLSHNEICESLMSGKDNGVLKGIDSAQNVLKWSGTLSAAWSAASGLTDAGKWIASGFRMPRWGTTTTTTTGARETDKDALLARTKELIETMKQVMIRIEGITSTDDDQLKLFCAKEMLEEVQNAGGIWPKISQNLAVRPDLIEDDFARNKLKETQSGNKNQGREKTLKYIDEVEPKVNIEGMGLIKITDFMEYDRFLSAGSVGQVDLWKLKRNTATERLLADEFVGKVLPADWHGGKERFIVKTVFQDTEKQYLGDWTLLEILFTKFESQLPKAIQSVWDVLKNLESSIFDEFDLRKEAGFTTKGREMLRVFSEEHAGGVRVTTPVGLETSSKYVMIQTLAPGKPLSDYMEGVKGQWDRLADWRTDIYSTILKVFGYSSIQHGFFQADPHPGNWFWETSSRTLTLIDWGGVENWQVEPELKAAHCNLAQMYSTMGHLSEVWNLCDAVIVSIPDKADLTGTYERSGVAIYKAREGEDELLLGHTYSTTYKHSTKPYTLWYNGEIWQISGVVLADPGVTTKVAVLKQTPAVGPPDQTFFGLALGKHLASGEKVPMQWELFTGVAGEEQKGSTVTGEISSGHTAQCDNTADRTQAYQIAAHQLGIKLKSICDSFMYLDATDKILQQELRTDPIAMVCIRKDPKDGSWKARTGVPPKDYAYDPDKQEITITYAGSPTGADGEDNTVEDVRRLLAPGSEGESKAVAQANHRLTKTAVAPLNALTQEGIGSDIEWEEDGLGDGSGATADTKRVVWDQAMRAYALGSSLFDSDVAEAAVMALNGRQSMSMFIPAEAPETYTLFARCALVFHGMMLDVLKENSMRLVPIANLQWLLQPQDDRFFEAWKEYADAFISKGTCDAGDWAAIKP